MKIVCMLNWFDEQPHQLRRRVREAFMIGCTHVVAVDGAYALFPGSREFSSSSQGKEITDTAFFYKLGCIIYKPEVVWAGNEVEKRQNMLDICLAITTDDDWLFLMDADFHIEPPFVNMTKLLAKHPGRFGDVLLTNSDQDAGWYPVRLLYRAVRGMHLTTNHYTYHYPDGDQTVMNNPRGDDLERGLKIPIRVRHEPNNRLPGRRERQVAYYERRHQDGIES